MTLVRRCFTWFNLASICAFDTVQKCLWSSTTNRKKFEQSRSIHLRMRSLGLRAGLVAHLQIRNWMEFHHVPL